VISSKTDDLCHSLNPKHVNLNLGCGIWVRKGFINVDKFYTFKQLKEKKGFFKNAKVEEGAKYIQGDILSLPFEDDYADYIECNDVIEHIPFRFVFKALEEMKRVLKPGGKLILVTCDFTSLALEWVYMMSQSEFNPVAYERLTEVIYGNQLNPEEYHRSPMTAVYLGELLSKAGLNYAMVRLLKGQRFNVGTIKMGKHMVLRNDQLVGIIHKPGEVA